jgi:hypothetical protein
VPLQVDAFIQYDLGYSKDADVGKGTTGWFKVESGSGSPDVIINYRGTSTVKRAKSSLMAFQHRKATFEVRLCTYCYTSYTAADAVAVTSATLLHNFVC